MSKLVDFPSLHGLHPHLVMRLEDSRLLMTSPKALGGHDNDGVAVKVVTKLALGDEHGVEQLLVL
jgi:hypothetical protein